MAIYGVTIKGRTKRVLVRETSQAQAVAHFVTAKALTAEEMQDALDEGETVWKPGTDLPPDEPAPAAPTPNTNEKPADPPPSKDSDKAD
jgi:hypothetical protein